MHIIHPTLGIRETMRLLRNLHVALKAGISINNALSMLEHDSSPRFKKTVRHLRKSIESGNPLSTAMQHSPYRFSPMVISLVHTGEIGGTMEESCAQIVNYLHTTTALRQKVKSAMMYPTFVSIAILGLGLSIGTFVLPELIPLFDSLNVELPFLTRALLSLARYFQSYGIVTAVCVCAGVAGLLMLRTVNAIKPIMHMLIMHIPYVGGIIRKSAIAQLSHTLATLLHSGIPIADAVHSTAESIDNRVYRRLLKRSLRYIEKGRHFSDALKNSSDFPSIGLSIISVGEQTGTLAESLDQLGSYYEEEADYAVKNLTTALEPTLLIIIGIIVGATILAIITPIYEITGSIR